MSDLDRLLLDAADAERRGHALFGNQSAPLKRAGLIEALHEGWGVYGFRFTAIGRDRLRELVSTPSTGR